MNKTLKRILTAVLTVIAVNLLVNLAAYFLTRRANADGKNGMNVITHTLFKRDK